MIPKIVYEEIVNKKDSFEVLLIKKEMEKKRIVLVDIERKSYSLVLNQFKLDGGEAAAYALFKKIKGKAILSDDRELIKLCKIENVPFITAMAVVVKLFKKKRLTKTDTLEKLEKLYGYGRYSDEIYNFFKSEVVR
jgi:predicted nucleic acid-binding protein